VFLLYHFPLIYRPSKPILVLITATKGVPIVVMMVSALVGGTAKVRKYNKPIVSAQFTFAMVGLLGYLSMDWYDSYCFDVSYRNHSYCFDSSY
jgi:hypothetical protein